MKASTILRVSVAMEVVFAAGAQAAPPPSPAELAALAPRLALAETGITNFTARGTVDAGPFQLGIGVAAARPDAVVLSLFDPRDGTPLMFGCGGRLMLYDPLKEEVLLFAAWPALKIEIETPDPASTNSAKINLWIGFQTVRSNATTRIDLASMAAYAAKDRTAQEESKGAFRLTGCTRDGGRLRAVVRPGRAEGAYVRVELCPRETPDQPALVLDDLRINAGVRQSLFRFPAHAIRESGLRVRELDAQSSLGQILDMSRLMKAMAGRMALVLPDEAREDIARKLLLGRVDWNAVRERDARTSAILRKILPAVP